MSCFRTSSYRLFGSCIALSLAGTFLLPATLRATENSASVYPVGVETVMPGMIPPDHGTMLFEFSTFYEADELNNSTGSSASPEFKLRVLANAFKLVHNWGFPLLGGKVNSNIAVPALYEELHIPSACSSKNGIGNVTLGLFEVGYQRNALHWYYEGDVYLPGAAYAKSDVLNIGQHNYAVAPVAAFTWLPRQGAWEVSSKYEYIVNFRDAATNYRSGNEFTWEYVAMKQVSHRAALGLNGYLYQQTTGDVESGAIVGDGNLGRDLALGPEVRISPLGQSAIVFKYFRDTMVENKPAGNAFWFQMGLPLHLGRSVSSVSNRADHSTSQGE
jgi:hypothetical protein